MKVEGLMKYILAYDIGTTGLKTCLFSVEERLRLLASAGDRYGLYVFPDGGAEQHAEEWWEAMCRTTREIFARCPEITPAQIGGISFCSQMQGLILADKNGVPVRHPMSYMDQRAKEEIKKGIAYGPQIAGANIGKLIPSLIITGAVTSSVKDPVWKYKWVEAHEPENFSRAYRMFDVKDYLICRLTGQFKATEDSAFGTLLYDTRKGREGWSRKMCRMFGIRESLLPEIIRSTDCAGGLTGKAAAELGLKEGTPVFGGGGDTSCIAIGAGSTRVGDTHIYSGTSGWVITVTDKRMVDVDSMIAAITGAVSGKFNYFAEMETAGKSIQWMKEQILADSAGLYPEKKGVTETDPETYPGIYEFISEVIGKTEPGSGGVIYAPWLHGNRCPFEDPDATGMFLGIRLETGKAQLMRAVAEGVFYHLRWMLECQDRKLKTAETIRFVGGTAQSPCFCQMLADILGRRIETIAEPQNAGSYGAAALAAVGLGAIPDIGSVAEFIPAKAVYEPDPETHRLYEKPYRVFKQLYRTNRRLFAALAK